MSIEITADQVSIVTDMAVAAKDIDEARAEEARQRAAARLRDKISDEEVATVIDAGLDYLKAIGAVGGAVPEPPEG